MPIIRRANRNGHSAAATLPVGTAPSTVGSLAAGTPTATTIPVTYTAATGSATIAYAGETSLDGTTWTSNGGTFTSSGGTFTGLASATAYHLRMVASNGFGSSRTLLAGTVSTAAATAAATGTANRYDLTIDRSAGPAGTARTVTATPNGNWGGGTMPIVAYNGGSSVSVGTITLPSSGGVPQTISWTPTSVSAGEWIVKGTNNGGLYDPYGAPFNVFSPSSGTARTISASLSLLDNAVHQRDTPSGNPLGFSASWAKGWGEVWIGINSISGASDGVWVQLRDALNSDATLSGWVQVYGPISATGQIRVLLPAGPYVYHLGVSTASDGSSAIQLAQRFKVGHVAAVAERSYECGLARSYGYGAGASVATTYTKTATWLSYNVNSSNTDTNSANYTGGVVGWFVHDGSSTDPYFQPFGGHGGEGTSSATEEWGRLIEATYGVCGGLVGAAMNTWGLDSFINHDGALGDGFGGTIHFASAGKAREAILATGGWDGVDSSYPTETLTESMHRYTAVTDWIAKNFPSVATISICAAASGWFGSDGSNPVGYTRMQCAIADQIEAANAMVVSRTNLAWNEYGAAGHSSMAARVQYARTGVRQARAGEAAAWGGLQTTNRGPTLKSTGATVNSSGLVRIPGNFNGGTAISGVGINFSNPTWTVGTATSAELASLFSVYGSGGYFNNGSSYGVTSAVVNTSSLPSGADFTIDLQVTSPPSTDLSVHYGADLGVDNGTIKPAWEPGGSNRAVFFADNVIDTTNGYEFGWELRPKVDIAVTRI